MKFRSAYDGVSSDCFQPVGRPVSDSFVRCVDLDGRKSLKPADPVPTFEMIQTAAKGVLLGDLIKRSINGDPNAIPKSAVVNADFLNAPTSLMDAQNKIIEAKNTFYKLSADVRKQYNNSLETFVSAINDGSFFKDVALSVKASNAAKEIVNNEKS